MATTITAAAAESSKKDQVLNDLAGFYMSTAISYDPESPKKVTPPSSDEEKEDEAAPSVQRNQMISSADVSRRRRGNPKNKMAMTSKTSTSLAPIGEHQQPSSSTTTTTTSRDQRRSSRGTSNGSSGADASDLRRLPPGRSKSGDGLQTARQRPPRRVQSGDSLRGSSTHGCTTDSVRGGGGGGSTRRKESREGISDSLHSTGGSNHERRGPSLGRPASPVVKGVRRTASGNKMNELRSSSQEGDVFEIKLRDDTDDDEDVDKPTSFRRNNEGSSSGRRTRGYADDDDINRSMSSGRRSSDGSTSGRRTRGYADDDDINRSTSSGRRRRRRQDGEGKVFDGEGRMSGSDGDDSDFEEEMERRNDEAKATAASALLAKIKGVTPSGALDEIQSASATESGGSSAGVSALDKLKAAGSSSSGGGGGSALDRLKAATQTGDLDKLKGGGDGEGGRTRRAGSKWAALKGGNDFIKNTKAALTEGDEGDGGDGEGGRKSRPGSKWSALKTGNAFIKNTKTLTEEHQTGRSSRRSERRQRPRSPDGRDGDTRREGGSSSSRREGSRRSNRPQPTSPTGESRKDGESSRRSRSSASRSAASKWAGVKGSVEFINKTKAKANNMQRAAAKDDPTKRVTASAIGISLVELARQGVEKKEFTSTPASQRSPVKRSNSGSSHDESSQEEKKDEATSPVKKPASSRFKNLLSMAKDSTKAKESKDNDGGDKEQEKEETSAELKVKKTTSSLFKSVLAKSNEAETTNDEEEKEDEASAEQKTTKSTSALFKSALSKATDEEGESKSGKKRNNKWTALKGGLDFTNRLMGKAKEGSDEFKKEDKDSNNNNDNNTESKKKPSKWNIASKVKPKKKKEPPLDYGLMMSIASFSSDALDGVSDFNFPETVEEGDEEESESEDEGNQPDSQPDAFALLGGNSAPTAADDSKPDAFLLFCGSIASTGSLYSASDSKQQLPEETSQPDAFALFGGSSAPTAADDSNPDAFALVGGSIAPTGGSAAPALDKRRMLMSQLAEPSMRFDYDHKNDTFASRTQPDMIEEGDEEEEDEDEDTACEKPKEAAPSLVNDRPETILEEEEEETESSEAEEEGTQDGNGQAHPISNEEKQPVEVRNVSSKLFSAKVFLKSAIDAAKESDDSDSSFDLNDESPAVASSKEAEETEPLKEETKASAMSAMAKLKGATQGGALSKLKSATESGGAMENLKGAVNQDQSDEGKRSRKKNSKWSAMKGGLEFTNRLINLSDHKKSDPSKKKNSKWNISTKLKKKEPPTMDYGMMMSVASFSEDAMEGLPAFQTQATITEEGDEHSEDDNSEHESIEMSEEMTPENSNGSAFPEKGLFLAHTQPDIIEEGDEDEDTEATIEEKKTELSVMKEGDTNLETSVSDATEILLSSQDLDVDETEKIANKPVERSSANGSEQYVENNIVLSRIDEDDGIPFLSHLKCLQLQIGPVGSKLGDELAISIHGLSDNKEEDDEMRVHHMQVEGEKFDQKKYFCKTQRFRIQDERGDCEAITESDIRDKEDDESVAEEGLTMSASSLSGEDDCLVSMPTDDGQMKSAPSDIQAECERLVRELEASQKRTKMARESVKSLQLEIQKKRHHYGEIECRKQLSMQELERKNIVLKRVHKI